MIGLLNQKQNITRRRAKKGLMGVPFKKGSSKKRSKARLRGGLLAFQLFWFYPLQLIFVFLFIVAFGGASLTGIKGWLVGETALGIMMVSWVLILALGSTLMLYALAVFTAFGVPLRGSKVFLGFILCLAGYWTPFLFLGPWVLIWIGIVIHSQK